MKQFFYSFLFATILASSGSNMEKKKVLYGKTILTVVLLLWRLSLFAGPRFDRYDHVSHNYDEGGGFALLILLIILAFIYLFRKK